VIRVEALKRRTAKVKQRIYYVEEDALQRELLYEVHQMETLKKLPSGCDYYDGLGLPQGDWQAIPKPMMSIRCLKAAIFVKQSNLEDTERL
jgi:hypothetical protein